MTDVTVTFPVVFGPQRDRPRKNVVVVTAADAPVKRRRRCAVVPEAAAPDAPTSRTARSLALATLIQRRIEAGEIRDHAHAAELLGITAANVNYLLNLTYLAADIQEALLVGDLVVSERRLRPVARMLGWEEQRQQIERDR